MKRRGGFTLIEMIGVLAVIAILAAMVAPKIFKVINDSRVTRMAGDIRGISSGVADWYKDLRTLNPLAAAGTIVTTDDTAWDGQLMTNGGTTATTGLWSRWQGPYIDGVGSITSIGDGAVIENCASDGAAPSATTCAGVSFDDNATADVAANRRIVWLTLQNVAVADFEALDEIMDPGMATATIESRGKVKYDATGLVLRVYLASN
ncbi:MAG: prepilin-type N-terminal cleavage/methylation domain-containing protein [Nitrospinae bacterium]|nr:prepilin-type N-terminal cleavage/methylation domain-containing protein [Nitrospinota bacterium]